MTEIVFPAASYPKAVVFPRTSVDAVIRFNASNTADDVPTPVRVVEITFPFASNTDVVVPSGAVTDTVRPITS